MPSIRALGTFALVLAARPAQSFLTPTSGRTRKGYSLPASCRTPFCGRLQRASSSAASTGGRPRRTRGGAGGVLMMAKKKASGKKKAGGKGGSAQGSRKVGRNISSSGSLTVDTNKAGGENGSGSGVAIADAEDVSGVANASGSSTSVGSSSDDAGVEVTTIQNRVSDIEPVEVSEEVSAVGAVVEPSESESGKGFGAPISQPKAPPRKAGSGSTSRPGVPVTSMMGGGEESTSDPVPTQTIAAPGTSQNPMSPSAVPMDDSHRMVLPEGSGELSEASLELDEGVGAMTTDPSQMTPLDLLRYFRDNNIAVDLETMNPVEIPAEREAKMAAMFPFPTEEARARRSLGPRPKPSEFVKAMVALLPEDAPWDPKKIRPLTELKEFLVANRLHSGSRAMNVISSMMLKAMGQGDLEHAKTLKGLGICIAKAEDAITGPFRQAVMSAEGRLAPRMGSLECEEYAGEDGADMAGMWIVLKACVAEWELRLRQIRQEEVGLHDIFRAIPNPAEGLSEDRAASITASVQAMGMSFSGNEKLMGSLPAELRFLEGALGLSTTTDVRRFALQEFCPKEGVSPEDLRFRMRSLICGLEQMPRNSYHQLQVAVEDVTNCLMEGTPEAYNIYNDNWQEGENLSFDTYRVKTEDKRRLRLRNIITAPAVTQKTKEENPYEPLFKQILPKGLWKAADVTVEDEETPYVMVKEGWLDSLDFLDEELTQYRQAKTDSMRKTLPELEPGEEGWNADPSDDIFTDWLQQEESMFLDFELTDDEEIIAASGIRDGPGPGMRELDMGFDLPEEFEEMAAKLEDDDSTDTFIKRS